MFPSTSRQTSRAHYQSRAVSTAGPAQLILMLYDRTLASLHTASAALASLPQDIQIAHDELTRAQDIIMELTLSLDHENGAPIAASLAALYDFCHRSLVEANAAKISDPLGAVVKVIADLRAAWLVACVPESLA